MCNWSVSNRETTKAAHNRKVLEGKLTERVFFGKFMEIPKQKVFFRVDELKWRWRAGDFYFTFFFMCLSHIFLKEMQNTLQVLSLHFVLTRFHACFIFTEDENIITISPEQVTSNITWQCERNVSEDLFQFF